MTNPVPVPRRGPSGRRPPWHSFGCAAALARRATRQPTTTLATGRMAVSATSANLVRRAGAPPSTAGGAAMLGPGLDAAGTGAETAGAGDSDPATIAPTRKPTVAVSPAVNQAKRRVMASL